MAKKPFCAGHLKIDGALVVTDVVLTDGVGAEFKKIRSKTSI